MDISCNGYRRGTRILHAVICRNGRFFFKRDYQYTIGDRTYTYDVPAVGKGELQVVAESLSPSCGICNPARLYYKDLQSVRYTILKLCRYKRYYK